ncbi:MAG: hypothetical protein ABR567_16745 [Myxococcales bacterium]|nr:hypothetical protein [Myxococcales bacterium]
MIRALFIAALAAALACNSTQTVFAGGQFVSPTGLAVTTAADRDILFVANQGQDNLRALQLCNRALFPDGGVDPADTCPRNEDQQFLPGKIRVFPANIETRDRPLHLAGARLLQADGGATGAVLAVGADTNVRVVDARNLVDATHGRADAGAVMTVPLGGPVADVVAINAVDVNGIEVGSPAVTALAVTLGPPAQLVALSVGVDPDGGVATPAVVGQCTLDRVVARRIAVAPGGDTAYIADGASDGGDGVVTVAIPTIAVGGACTMNRIKTGLTPPRPARSVAVSPLWYDDAGTPHPAGEFVMMILEPGNTADAGTELDPGGVLIARANDRQVVPIPPYSIDDKTAGLQAMEPITPPGMAREAAFLPSLPADVANCDPGDGGPPIQPCTPLYTGAPTNAPVERFNLLAAVSSTNGNTYFVDVLQRRFVNSTYYDALFSGAEQTPGTNAPTISVSVASLTPPMFNFMPPDAGHPNIGWMTAGVTHQSLWQAEWHSAMPGLQTRGGTLTSSTDGGTMLFKASGLDLQPWVDDPILALRAADADAGTHGDVVGFSGYVAPVDAGQPCKDLAATEAQSPLRFEVEILNIVLPDTLEVATLAPTDTERGFNADACPTGLGAAATVRTARDLPWLVFDESTPRGRTRTGDAFFGTERRFDYPLDYDAGVIPRATDNIALAFFLTGDEPQVPGTRWSVSLTTGMFPVYFGDTSIAPLLGVASDVITYRSPRRATQVFTAVTGQNSVVQADPLLPLTNTATVTGGVITYK